MANIDSDETLKVNSTNLVDTCNEWKNKVSSIDLSSIDVSSTFSALIDLGIGTSYFSSLQTALTRADKLATNISTLIDMSATDQEEVDDNNAQEASDNSYGNAKYDRDSSSDSGSSAASSVADSSAGTYTADNSSEDTSINSDNETQENSLDTSEEEEVVTALEELNESKTTIELIEEDSVIKNTLLESQYISDDLKEKIATMDENEIKTELSNILESSDLLSDFSKSIIQIFDNDLKNNFEEATVVDSASSISKVYELISKESNFQEQIKEIYLGSTLIEEVDDSVITFTRSYVNLLASTYNVSYEDILNDSKYQEVLLDGIEDIKESFYLISLSNEMSNS